jgi:hypothetical protein
MPLGYVRRVDEFSFSSILLTYNIIHIKWIERSSKVIGPM